MMLTLADLGGDSGAVVALAAIGCGSGIAIVSVIFTAVKKMVVARSVEDSRRELAAYVAEGSITAADAERILRAGPDKKSDA